MSDPATIAIIGGGIAVVGGIAWVAWMLDKKRRAAFESFAQENGFSFLGDDASVMTTLSRFKVSTNGHTKRPLKVIRGLREGRSFTFCDYQYTTGYGRNRTVHTHTLVLVEANSAGWAPHFFVRRQRSFFDAVGKLFGGQDINFDEDPKFSKGWVLQGSDETSVRQFFSQPLRDFFSETPANFMAEHVDGVLLVDFARAIKPTELPTLMTTAINLRRHW